MAAFCILNLLRPAAPHSIRPLSPIPSNSWPCKRTPTSSNSIIKIGSRRWNYKRMTLSTSASAQEFSSLNTSSEVEMKEDGNEFNWFQQWYPAAPEYDLDKKVPHAFTVLGLDIVVWWDKREQAWRVFDDSCPHRRAPLSEGRIDEDGDLQCSYHGWCFGSRGECKRIPQAPLDGPPVHTSKRACASVYPSIQQQGIIWFWPNTDPLYKDIVQEKNPPFIPVLSDPSFRFTDIATRDLPYGYEILTENLLDPSHIPYAHHGLMAQSFNAGDLIKMGRRAGKPVDFRVHNLDKSGFQGEGETGSAIFVAPFIIMRDVTLPPSTKGKIQTLIAGTKEAKPKTTFLVFICVPVAPGRSRIISITLSNFDSWADLLFPRWMIHIQLNIVLDSDSCFLHLEEHKLQEYGQRNWEKACYVPTKADAFVISFRKWLKRYASNGVPWGEKYLNGSLPPTPPKEQLMDRYWSHVVKCRSCKGALATFKALEIIIQLISILSVAMLGAIPIIKQTSLPSYLDVWSKALIGSALSCYLISRWLSHFIYKTYYFHDYNHALVK